MHTMPHRAVGVRVDLDRVFTWQEERRLTGSLTLHYKRVVYVVDPDCEAAKSARGKRVLVREDQAGEVVIEHHGVRLPAHAFPKDAARVRQGAIVDNKLLGPTLELIQAVQRERVKETLQTRRLTLREEDLMRKSMGDNGLHNRRPKRAAKTAASSCGGDGVGLHADRLYRDRRAALEVARSFSSRIEVTAQG
jgi:hypothetical protein